MWSVGMISAVFKAVERAWPSTD